ncbi:hypothetical protein YC2023_001428 [Brassica napus]
MAIAASNERDGLSKEAISRYIQKNYTGKPTKFAASPDACLEVPRSRILTTTNNDQHTPDLAGVSASQPQKHAGRRGGASNLDDMRPPGRPTKNRAATMVPALVLAGSSSTVCQQRVKEDTVISLSSDSSESDDDESDVSFTLNHKKKGERGQGVDGHEASKPKLVPSAPAISVLAQVYFTSIKQHNSDS